MSKQKKLRKIVLDKLYYKNQNQMKKSTRSNAPTQSTPNEPKNISRLVENFFQNFESQCAIIHEPVKINDRKPLKRSLQYQLSTLLKNEKQFRLKTQQTHVFRDIIKNHMPEDDKKLIKIRLQSQYQIKTESDTNKSKQKKILTFYKNNDEISKNKSSISTVISPETSSLFTKQNSYELLSYQSKEPSPNIKIQKNKNPRQKTIIYQQKDSYKYLSNSKNTIGIKNLPKNAPKKIIQKQCGLQRIKRVQSLKSLNENGIRKYSYKRQN